MKEKMEKRAEKLNGILEKKQLPFRIEYCESIRGEGYVFLDQNPSGQLAAGPILDYGDWWEQDDPHLCEFLKTYYENALDHFQKMDCTHQLLNLNRDYIKSHVLPRLMPKRMKWKIDRLHMVSIPYLDMFITFFVPITDEANCQINQELCNQCSISIDELSQWAVCNLEPTFQFKKLSEVISDMGIPIPEIADDTDLKKLPPEKEAWVLTNHSLQYGAACILNKNIVQMIYQKVGPKFIMLPSSIHEVIIVKNDPKWDKFLLLSSVISINLTTVDKNDFLSNNIYLYEGDTVKAILHN